VRHSLKLVLLIVWISMPSRHYSIGRWACGVGLARRATSKSLTHRVSCFLKISKQWSTPDGYRQTECDQRRPLLRERSLSGTVTTSDALLTQRTQAPVIRACDGQYLISVKRNQRSLWDENDLWRSLGWTNIADAIRDCAASLPRTLAVIGAIPSPTLT
jgi:hypothetical protein